MTGEHPRTLADLGWDTWVAVGLLLALAIWIAVWMVRSARRERRQAKAARDAQQRYWKE